MYEKFFELKMYTQTDSKIGFCVYFLGKTFSHKNSLKFVALKEEIGIAWVFIENFSRKN